MVVCLSMILVTGTITPLIIHLYNPSRRYKVYRKRTVMNSRTDSELRVLICIHEQENVPTMVNLLEALNPSKRSPLAVFALHLIELVGRANPVFITHKLTRMPSNNDKNSAHVVNALRYFENSNHDVVTVFPFTAISPTKTMHDDVCTIALEKRTSLIILPYHKRYQDSGAVVTYKRTIKITNHNVLDKAPCSIAILVDRGAMNTSKPISGSRASYCVALLFLGGNDDREALAIAARMAGHHNISLTIIRLVEHGNISNDSSERKIDNTVISECRTALAGNYRVMYKEEVVMDGTGTISVIRSMENRYELVIVGRHHDERSKLVLGLMDWEDDSELGTVSNVLASSHFMGNTTILVVQQHADVVNKGPQDRGLQKMVDEEAKNMPSQIP